MYRTKKEVDRHVLDILSKVQNENERNLKGFPIAKLYYQVKDYEMSKRYLAGYLSVRDSHATAHKLMGQILEALGNKESALQSYKRSLDIDVNQKDLVLKICELYCDLPVDPDTARYWADRAEKIFNHHKVIFRLRECIVNAEGEPNIKELEQLITTELNSRPKDVTLYTKLLKLYTDTERVEEAYRYAADVEIKKPFPFSIDWYYCLADIFEAYQEEKSQLQLQFCLEYFVVLDHLCTLLLAEPHALSVQDGTPTKHGRSVADAAAVLHTFDKFLQRASSQASVSQDPSWKYLKHQMHGQLYLHLGTLLIKRAKKERTNWKEACRYASALYLLAYTFKPGSLQQETWYCKLETNKQIFLDVQRKAYLRLSYAGHVLWSLCSNKDERPRWLQKVKQETCVQQAQDKIFQRAFSSIPAPRHQTHHSSRQTSQSFFLQDTTFVTASLEFPTEFSVYEYDKVSHKMYPSSLHHLVWFGIHWLPTKLFTKQPKFQVFEKLQLSNALLNSGAPESLCQLDVDAFLSATTFCAWGALEERSRSRTPGKGLASQAMILSVSPDICDPLCTPEQAAWWRAAHSLHFNEAKDKMGEMRQTLRRGLEAIRGVGAHGMDVPLLVHLARHFAKRSDNLRQSLGEGTPSEEVSVLADRATHYWNLSLLALDKLQGGGNSNHLAPTPSRSQVTTSQKHPPLFPSFQPELSVQEAIALMEEARYYLACRLMMNGHLADAAQAFSRLTSAEAAHYNATVLVRLSQQPGQDGDARVGLLAKARDALYLTLDRISGNKQHPLNLQLHEEIEAVELKLAQSQNNGVHPDKGSEESSLEDEEIGPVPLSSINGNSSQRDSASNNNNGNNNSSLRDLLNLAPGANLNGSLFDSSILDTDISRPRLRPSPERLDAQIRALSYNQVGVMHLLLEQQRTLMESVKGIVEELRQNKNLIEELKKTVGEMQNSKHSSQPGSQILGPNQVPVNPPLQRHLSQRTRSMRSSQQQDDENETEEFEEGGHPEPGHLYEYALDADESSFDYGSYLHDPRNPSNIGYPMMMHYPPHYAQPPHMAAAMQPPLPPQSLLSQRPPRSCYPAYGTALTFSEGQQLPQFNFRMPPPSPAIPVPSINAIDNRTSVFARLGQNHGGMVQAPPPPAPMWENQPLQPPPSLVPPPPPPPPPPPQMSQNVSPWSNKGSNGAPHAFQIPLPAANFATSQPPSILSNSQPTFGSPQMVPVSESGNVSKGGTPVFYPTTQGFQKSTPEVFQGFSTPGNVSSSSAGAPVTPSSAQKELSDTEDVDFDFKPAIPLPDEVDVCTGEEQENVLFEERAKLFRFVDKEWKERGVGTLKILLDKNTGKIRLLMRRDQVLKVCANHHILASMQLQPMKEYDRAWIWAAQDFAEETLKSERFCVRFKNKDLAQSFKKAFEAAVEKDAQRLKNAGPSVFKSPDPVDSASYKPFGDMFKPATGSWFCPTCMVSNLENALQCLCCDTPKPGTEKKTASVVAGSVTTTTTSSTAATGFTFGGPPVVGGGFAMLFQNKSTMCTKCKVVAVSAQGDYCLSCKPAQETKPQAESDKNVFINFGSGFSVKPQAGEGQKSEFGGFTFSSTPVIKPASETGKDGAKLASASSKADRPTVTAISKQKENTESTEKTFTNPFASFQFSSKPAASETKSNVLQTTPVSTKEKEKEQTFLFGQLSNTSNLTFSQVSSDVSPAFKTDPNFKGFPGSGKQLFSPQDGTSPKDTSKDGLEDFIPSAEFQPVIPLPELVDTRTGEEEEEKLFVERAKLYRFVSETKEWKERGIGDVKILKNPQSLSCRILMRREQVLKICANHLILPEMELTPMSSSDKAWIWFAQDYSDGELNNERFAIKFKNKDTALLFKQIFEECQKTTCSSSAARKSEKTSSTLNSFKPKEGSWECPGCLTRQDAKVEVCPACQTGKPTATVKPQAPHSPKQTEKSLAEIFKPEEGSWSCEGCYVRNMPTVSICVSCSTPKENVTGTPKPSPLPSFSFVAAAAATKPPANKPPFSFGTQTINTDNSTSSPFKMSGFNFSAQTDKTSTPSGSPFKLPGFTIGNLGEKSDSPRPTGFTFGGEPLSLSKANTPLVLPGHTTPPPAPPPTAEGFEFKFGSPQKFEFRFSGVRPRSPSKAPKSPGTPSDSAKDGTEDDAETSDGEIFFQPVIPLPPKVDVKTGEEGEEVLYCHRAKLFRLDQGEWKERGTGDVKILKDLQTEKIRLLMRREQVLKVCMNHLLPVDLEIQEKGDRTWFWSAVDYADGSPQPEQLALRFKNHEVAESYKKAIEEAKDFLRKQSPELKTTSPEIAQPENSVSSQVPVAEKPSSPTRSSSKESSPSIQAPPVNANASPSFGFPAKIGGSNSFVFGNQQTANTSVPGTFVFGGTFLGTSTSPASQNKSSVTEIEVVEEKTSPEDKQNLAQSLQLPVNFYRYEEKDPCLGCRGCDDQSHHHDTKDTDLQLVFVEEATEEQKAKARHLMLPESFYLYEKKTPCPGCRGCQDEESSPLQSGEKKLVSGQDLKSAPAPKPLQDSVAPSAPVTDPSPVKESGQKPDAPGEESTKATFGGFFSSSAASDLSFAALASQGNNMAFKLSSGATGFAGVGSPLFASQQSSATSPNEKGEESEEVVPSADVHFDPLVPLPELVDIKTGEEDEAAVFSQRARLYRYVSETKQWKERGVGEMKILKHNSKCQFRLLLRRDQVLKIACNHLITPTLQLSPMQNSNNSVVWSALDFSEGFQSAETFCIKFKNEEFLQEFQQKVEECKVALTSQPNSGEADNSINSTQTDAPQNESSEQEDEHEEDEEGTEWSDIQSLVQASGEDYYYKTSNEYEGASQDSIQLPQDDGACIPDMAALNIGKQEQDEIYHSEEEEDEDEEDEDEDEQVMFEKRITLSEASLGRQDFKPLGIGTLKVLYDDEVFGARIQVADDNSKLMCDHIVAVQTCLRVVDREATWTVFDMALPDTIRRQFKATFSSVEAAQEFQKTFDEAKNLAVTSEIVEYEEPTPNFPNIS